MFTPDFCSRAGRLVTKKFEFQREDPKILCVMQFLFDVFTSNPHRAGELHVLYVVMAWEAI